MSVVKECWRLGWVQLLPAESRTVGLTVEVHADSFVALFKVRVRIPAELMVLALEVVVALLKPFSLSDALTSIGPRGSGPAIHAGSTVLVDGTARELFVAEADRLLAEG